MFSVTIKGLETISLMTTQDGAKKLISAFSILDKDNKVKIEENTLEFKNEFISIYPINIKTPEKDIDDEFVKVFEKIKANKEETPEEKKVRLRKELEQKIKNSMLEENKKKEQQKERELAEQMAKIAKEEKARKKQEKIELAEVKKAYGEIVEPLEKAKREKKLFNEMISRRIKEQLQKNLEARKAEILR